MIKKLILVTLFSGLLTPQITSAYSGDDGVNGYISSSHSGPSADTCISCHDATTSTYSSIDPTVSFTSGCSSIVHDTTEACSIGLNGSTAVESGINMALYSPSSTVQNGALTASNAQLIAVAMGNELSHETPQAANFKWPLNINAPAAPGTYTLYFCINQVNGDDLGYDAFDGPPVCRTESVSITNSSPNAINDSYASIATLDITESTSFSNYNMCSNDTDSEGDTRSYVSHTALSQSSSDISISNNGSLTRSSCSFSYTPSAEFNGLAAGESTILSYNYTINDGITHVNGSTTYEDTATVTIRVRGENDSPVLGAEAETITVGEGGNISTVIINGDTGNPRSSLLFNDSDADDNDNLLISDTRTNAATTNGTLTIAANGSFTYTHNGLENISDSFTYMITDGTATSISKTVSITITPANDAPISFNDTANVNEAASVDINVQGNDTDAEGTTPLSAVSIESTTAATYGSVTDLGRGVLRYIHNGNNDIVIPGATYTDTFTYRANDGALTSADATVTVTITELNDAPVAVNNAYVVDANTNNNAFDVLANDTDPDNDANDAFDTMQIISTSTATAGGSVSIVGSGDKNTLFYNPATDSQTPESFTYTMRDAAGLQSTATVNITFIDTDTDGFADALDNCTLISNNSQLDTDNDGLGDVCDNDPTGSGVLATFIVFNVDQGAKSGNIIFQDAGDVTVTAGLDSTTGAGTVTYSFLQTSASLINAPVSLPDALNNTFEFDPTSIPLGAYTIDTIIDEDGSTTHNTLLINIMASTEPTLNPVDTDGDGTNDNDPAEGFADDDNDGIPNYRDNANEQITQLSMNTTSANAGLIESAAGTKLEIGVIASASGLFAGTITENAIMQFGNNGGAAQNVTDLGFTGISEIFDFIISDIPQIGGSVNIVFPLNSSLRPNSFYRKYTPTNGWQAFVVDRNNKIASANSVAGICPSPGSGSYLDGLNAFTNCLQLTLQDGGPNDSDGEINGIIRDPGMLAVDANTAITEADPCEQSTYNNCSNNSGGIGTLNPAWFIFIVLAGLYKAIKFKNE